MASVPIEIARLLDHRGPIIPWILSGATLLVTVLVLIGSLLLVDEAPIGYSDLPEGEAEISSSARRAIASSPLPPAPTTGANVIGGPPLLADPALLDETDVGRLPRIGADGSTSWRTYRRKVEPVVGPKIALLVHEIGLAAEPSMAAGMLPFVVALATSPYAADGPGWQLWTRALGHESLLELPVASAAPALGDGGPDALRPNEPEPVLIHRLQTILGRGRGYPAVVIRSGDLDPLRFRPATIELGRRGVGFIELGSRKLSGIAREAGLPYLSTEGPIDLDPSPAAIDAALGALEARALSEGQAIGHGRPLRSTIERIASWSQTLPQKGIHLVSPGALLGD